VFFEIAGQRKRLGEGGVLKAPHFTQALRYVKSTKVPNCYISPAFANAMLAEGLFISPTSACCLLGTTFGNFLLSASTKLYSK
jgi:hypothetical protein